MTLLTHDHEILPCYLESGDIEELDAEQQAESQKETDDAQASN